MAARSMITLALLAAVACGQKATFDKKVNTILSTYLGTNEPKASSIVADCLVKQQTIAQIKDAIMNNLVSIIPSSKYLPAMSMLNTWDSCLKNAGSSMDKAVNDISTTCSTVLATPYNAIITKMKAMTAAGNTTAQMTYKTYGIATSALTKTLVQKILNKLKALATVAQWNCSLPPLKTLLISSLYNLTKTA